MAAPEARSETPPARRHAIDRGEKQGDATLAAVKRATNGQDAALPEMGHVLGANPADSAVFSPDGGTCELFRNLDGRLDQARTVEDRCRNLASNGRAFRCSSAVRPVGAHQASLFVHVGFAQAGYPVEQAVARSVMTTLASGVSRSLHNVEDEASIEK